MNTTHPFSSSSDNFQPPLPIHHVDTSPRGSAYLILSPPSLSLLNNALRQTASAPRPPRNHRALFALQIKCLLKVLQDAREDELLQETRMVISSCTRFNRRGDPKYTPLETVIETYLRALVGNLYWEMAQNRQREFLQQKYRQRCTAMAAIESANTIRARLNSVPI